VAKSDTLSSSQGGEFSSEKRLCVARIATAHGIKGYVRAKIFMENPHDIEDYNPLFTSETGAETLHVTLKNPIKNQWLVEIGGVSDRTEAEKLRNLDLYINADALPEAEDGAFYYKDLIGLTAYDDKGETVGKVINVDNFGSGDLLEIKPMDGESFYLPFKDEFSGNIDLKAKTIVVTNFEDYRF
tara:strand:- start:82222 stop:82776 length:555 start_codon:yes stop_codon:yes gene_type:complete